MVVLSFLSSPVMQLAGTVFGWGDKTIKEKLEFSGETDFFMAGRRN
jgi:hypothetical protein